jgi:uncharacterized protein (DUF2345 family)
LHNGIDRPDSKGIAVIDSGSGAVNRRSTVSRRGHRIDLLDQAGQADGITLASGDGKLSLTIDATSTTVTVHADGTVKIEGSQGIVIDSAGAKLELKGGEVSINATSNLHLKGANTTLEGSAQTQVKGGALCSVSAALVKIN